MIPIVFSAGRGSRIGQETQDLPKWFLEIGNNHLCDYQLDALSTRFDKVYVVLGHGFAEENDPNNFIPSNSDIDIIPLIFDGWDEVENAGTALYAVEEISPSDDLLLLCGDVIIDSQTLLEFVTQYNDFEEGNCSAVAAFEGIQNEKTAVLWDDDRYITDYGAIEGHEEAGMFILNENHIETAKATWSNNHNDWFPIIFPEVKSKAVPIGKSGHQEINTVSDLERAREILTEAKKTSIE